MRARSKRNILNVILVRRQKMWVLKIRYILILYLGRNSREINYLSLNLNFNVIVDILSFDSLTFFIFRRVIDFGKSLLFFHDFPDLL
jgi:hypothetical protein